MVDLQLKEYLYRHKEAIIERWLEGIESRFPGLYGNPDLRGNADRYFTLLVDLDVELELHPNMEFVRQMARMRADQGAPVQHLAYASSTWRESLTYQILVAEQDGLHFPYAHIRTMCLRIDRLQENVFHWYWERRQLAWEQQEKKIHELHDDRLNLLGKMAASMAHELRNPLTAIEGFMKLLKMNLSEESLKKTSRYLDVIQKEFQNLHMHISGFLSFSKKDTHEEPFVSVTVQELADSVLNLIEPRLIGENVKLQVIMPFNPTIVVQRVALQQVLSNLINNSIDALHEQVGDRTILLLSDEDERNHYLHVIDNGPGIPAEIQHSIFQPFFTGKKSGTGLGLAICKQIMDKNMGDIQVDSHPGRTMFTLTLRKERGS